MKKRGKDEILSELQVLNSILSTLIEEKNRRNQGGKLAGSERDFIDVVLDAAAALTVVIDQEGRIICFNRACCETTGFSPGEAIGKFFWDLSPTGEEGELVRREFDRIKTGKRVNRLETSWTTKGGGKRLITWESTVLAEGKGEDGYIIGLGIDITDLREMEDNLRKSEEKYRTLIDTANDAIFLADAKTGIVLDANAKAGELLGLPVEEIIGRHQYSLHPKEEALKYRAIFEDAVKNGGGNYDNLAVLRNDGSRVPVDISASVTEIDGKKVIQGIFRDIRDRKKAERAIREREERLDAFFTDAPAGLVIVDKNLTFRKINETLAQVHGIAVEDHAGKTIEEVIPELSSKIIPVCRKVLEEGTPILNLEISGETHAMPGVVRHFVCSVFPIPGPDGRPAEVGWIIVEQTDQKQAEEALHASERHYRTLAESAPDYIFVVNRDMTVRYANPCVAELLRKSPGEITGKPLDELFPPAVSPMMMRTLESVFRTGEPYQNVDRIDLPEGTWWVDSKLIPIGGQDKGVSEVLGITRDITERKRMEEDLVRIQKLESVGTLAGGIAHDFNNLLTGILSHIELAKIRAGSPEGPFADLSDAEKISLRAKSLTQQLLIFAMGGSPVRKSVFVRDIVKESAEFALSGSNVTCSYSIPEDVWGVEVDSGQIGQAVSNIVINAKQSMPEGGRIQIGCENASIKPGEIQALEEGKYVRISIGDEGGGITKEHESKIFDPYFTTKEKGSGLGLATSHSIVLNHGGCIEFESEVGRGTTFHIYLPASMRQPEKRIEEQMVQDPGNGKILFMDDEEAIRKSVGTILSHIGYEVQFAKDGDEAIEMYQKELNKGRSFDAVIMDLTIPGGKGGREAIKKLLEIDPHIKAVASSGYSTDSLMSDFKTHGFRAALKKPYRVDELKNTLREVIDRSGE